tara:strand:- start:3460 stop:4284 length:825 start_codon:yes stop_codon:yes gene_type:complete
MSISLSRFNPKKIEEKRISGSGPATCVFIGKRGTGKSTLVADILYHVKNINAGVAISATEDGNAYYSKFIPDILIHSEYKPEIIQQVINRQKRVINSSKKNTDGDVFVLLDDCMYDKRMVRDTNIRGIFMNGRHWRITFLLTMQYCMDLPPDLRANIDYVFILRENIIQNQEKLYKNFFGIFPHFSVFQDVLNSCTEGYDCLVLDNTSKSNNIQDCVYWYKAKPNRTFKIGSKELWKYCEKKYDRNKAKDTDDYDEKKLKKKNTPSVTVKKLKK